jgi:hypothetical protein
MGRGGQNTMGRQGVQYILIIMGRGVIKFYIGNLSETNFRKNIRFMIYKFWNFENFLKILWIFFGIFSLIFFNLMKYVLKFYEIFEILNFFPPTLYNYWLLMRSTHDYTDLVNEWLTEVNQSLTRSA